MSSMKLFLYPSRMYFFSVFVKSYFLSMLQHCKAQAAHREVFCLAAWTHSFRKYWSQTTHPYAHTGTVLEEFRPWTGNKQHWAWGLNFRVCWIVFFTFFFVFTIRGSEPAQALSQHREPCPRTALHSLAMSELKKKKKRKMICISNTYLFSSCVRQTWPAVIVNMNQN